MPMIERAFERALWASRLIVLVPVVVSVMLSLAMVLVASVDAVRLIGALGPFLRAGVSGDVAYSLRLAIIGNVIEVVDGYLLASILLIFAMGLYELFVSKIDAAERSEVASRLLLIRSMDDLKSRLASVVLLILVVKFFQQALRLKYESPLDLLYLGLGILLIGGALFLGYRHLAAPVGGDDGSGGSGRAGRASARGCDRGR
jgi:uncharacterized membrane protein YqhA